MNKTKCKSCAADIFWVRTINGKNMPLDVTETIVFLPRADGETWELHKAHQSHFATCPHASHHRKSKEV